MKLLLTGFEPFGDFKTNPSWDALQLAHAEGMFAADVVLARIPVSYDAAFTTWLAAANGASAGLSFGLHGGLRDRKPATIYIETTARNRDGAAKADNSGFTRPEQPILPEGPPAIAATFPAAALLAALKQAGYEAELSDNAGSYLCNHLFYRAAHFARFPYGFVHVPPVDTMGGGLTLTQLAQAMALLANTLAHEGDSPYFRRDR